MDALDEEATELLGFCSDSVGDALRVISRYDRDTHTPVYTRSDIPDDLGLDEETRGMYRIPYLRMQKASQHLSRLNPLVGDAETIISYYGAVAIIQLPVTAETGITISVDVDGQLPEGFIAGCRDIVRE